MERLNNSTEIQNQHRNIELTDAETLKNLIEKVGLEKLNIALNELSNAEKISPIQTKKENKNYLAGLNIYKGLVTFKGVADAFSLKYTPASKALSD